ncbi:ribonuclease [Pueribacillus theae]|uniref:Ribonuclease n=1 Tax=Pueribacillus theae TaxID=2171751 RepID=A0A2U1JZM8_9BACI|nr:YihY/virulence factor BrkB family protein [Pueribacillus theae]PWA10404.1 ribonuclease [Pueribacillus theae]
MKEDKFINFGKAIFERIQHVRATEIAAELAYYFLLSLFPFLIFALTLLPYLGITTDDILSLVAPYTPDQAMNLIQDNLKTILDSRKGGLLSFGIIATIWSASNAINGIIKALNQAYEVEETRHFLVARGLAILLTIGMVVVIVVALLLPVFGKAIGHFIFSFLGLTETFLVVWEVFRWLISFSVIAFVLTFIYYMGPNKRLKFKQVMTGGIFATVGWLLSSYVFSFYVSNFGNYSSTYGSLGGVIILMIWFYVSAFIIILGGIINVLIHHKKEKAA